MRGGAASLPRPGVGDRVRVRHRRGLEGLEVEVLEVLADCEGEPRLARVRLAGAGEGPGTWVMVDKLVPPEPGP